MRRTIERLAAGGEGELQAITTTDTPTLGRGGAPWLHSLRKNNKVGVRWRVQVAAAVRDQGQGRRVQPLSINA
jgi:hypothetical protein